MIGNFWKRKIKSFIAGCLLFTFNTQKALGKLDKKCRKVDYYESDNTILIGGAWGRKEIHTRSTYGTGKIVKFENLDINIPCDFHQYLTDMYGDYMVLPPVEKRELHHYCCLFSLDRKLR